MTAVRSGSVHGRSGLALGCVVAGLLSACGGADTGNALDSGAEKTTLSVAASDADGDSLHYQWRVTGGTVDNRDSATTVWTLPAGPGLHFAYVVVSDGKGGHTEQQYAVSSDALADDRPAVHSAQALHTPGPVSDAGGTSPSRLRLRAADTLLFAPPGGGAAVERLVYLPDVTVSLQRSDGTVVFGGVTDTSGELSLPRLPGLAPGESYTLRCGRAADAPLANCVANYLPGVRVQPVALPLGAERNLRLFGHVALADGGVCGRSDEFFGQSSSASVRLKLADGTPLTAAVRINRFGDYALDAAVPAQASLKLDIQCEGYARTLDVPPAAGAAGYQASTPVELSHQIGNVRPRILRMVANGPDGSVRGRTVLPLADAESDALPGAQRFLAYKGQDTRRSACRYYRALGLVADCDAQGAMLQPVTMDDWKRANQLPPYAGSSFSTSAEYINKMDLNLVRRMSATRSAPNRIAFLVCNHPGPEGSSQTEIDQVLDTARADERLVACVGMEWSATAGVNGGQPFTKFVTFGPDGALLPSINLDGRGEKYLPGACVACHGGTDYAGRFGDSGSPSPHLGSGFLPFDTNNYFFSSRSGLTEADQAQALYQLNQLVRETEGPAGALPAGTPATRLIDGWYAAGGHQLDKAYLPPAWRAAELSTPGAAKLYREVVGTSCRTCHAALGSAFDWDLLLPAMLPATPQQQPSGVLTAHVCGGTRDLAVNASMPNALISRDRIAERTRADATLAGLRRQLLGCDTPLPDPAYPQR